MAETGFCCKNPALIYCESVTCIKAGLLISVSFVTYFVYL